MADDTDHIAVIDDIAADSYKHCISRKMPLSEELIDWFREKQKERTKDEANIFSCLNAELDVVRDFRLGFYPTQWHRILTAEAEAGCDE